MDWRSYIHTNNPVAAALLSKMGYTEKERVQVKKEFLRNVAVKMELKSSLKQNSLMAFSRPIYP